MAFIVDYAKNWALDTAGGYLKTGLQAGGTLAGNTVGGIGSTIENSGRAFGEGTVGGAIKGVGGSINNYGDGVRNVFAADGPVSGAQKTAVKPSAPVKKPAPGPKALPASSGAPKSLPAAGGKPKAPPAPSAKSAASPKPPAQLPSSKAPSTVGGPKPPASNKLPDGKVRISPESRPKPNANMAKPTAHPPMPVGSGAQPKPRSNAATGPKPGKPLPNGKVRISPESRPKPVIKA